MAEQVLSGFCKTISLRLPAVLGKGTHGWIAKIYESMKMNKKLNMLIAKLNNFIYEDIFKIIDHFIKKIFIDDQFNVSCSNITTFEKLLKIIRKSLNSHSKIIKQKKNQIAILFRIENFLNTLKHQRLRIQYLNFKKMSHN